MMLLINQSTCDKFFIKGNAIDASGFVSKTRYNIDKLGIKEKIESSENKYLILVGMLKKLFR